MNRHHNRSRNGFTLIELITAVAAVALLSLGIGRIFTSVSSLVSSGQAVAEVDQKARGIENMIRRSLARMALLEESETFLAIRSTRVGGPMSPLYLSQEDREYDESFGGAVVPYGEGSRAITARLDELIFLAPAGRGGQIISAQDASSEAFSAAAEQAIIYIGHGLVPARDPGFQNNQPIDISDNSSYPVRRYIPDGISLGDPWVEAFGSPGSYNEFATHFPLAYQELLLAGSLGMGYFDSSEGSILGPDREIALFPRDIESVFHTNSGGSAIGGIRLGDDDLQPNPPSAFARAAGYADAPRIGLIRHGKTDIVAMSPITLKRWLEGLDAGRLRNGQINPQRGDASPFDGGYLNAQGETPINPVDASSPDKPLYVRDGPDPANPGVGTDNFFAPNRRLLQSAIAGLFTRRLVETKPPFINRSLEQAGDDQPEDAVMDTHALLATGVSNFEIAWSDGTRALRNEVVTVGADTRRYRTGDIIWFDATFSRRAFINATGGRYYGGNGTDPNAIRLDPEIDSNQLQLVNGGYLPAAYDREASGGAPNEYLAIWPYRAPDRDGGYEGAWTKPKLLRFRLTIHDDKNVIREGKEFEFIVEVNAL